MRKHPKTFDPLFTNMIAAGEAGGILDTILKRLATYIEKAVKLKGQVKSAMIYPIAVIVIAGRRRRRHSVEGHPDLRRAVRRPRRRAAAADARRHLRSATTWSRFVPFLIVGARRRRLRRSARYYATDKRPPRRSTRIVLQAADPRQHPAQDRRGALLPHAVDAASARACRFSTASTSRPGPPATRSSRTPSWSTRKSIERGETIAAPLKETGVFPPMVVQMIGVGEATGALDTMLAKIADFYEEEVDTAVAGLLTLLEPVMIAVLGVVVGGIVIAMYLPIFDLISKLT